VSNSFWLIFVAEKEKPQGGPSGMAGLVRYYEDEKSLIKLKPEYVVYVCMGILVLEIALIFFKL
jgi:preprotein translocase subunit Sec61beta